MCKISIITVNYNNLVGLERTMKSVIAQQYSDLEFIVIDGNSTDGCKEFLENKRNHISTLVSEPDLGIYNAMNKGVTLATGDYLLFLNSGDHFKNDNSLNTVDAHISEKDLVVFDIEMRGKKGGVVKQHPDAIQFSYLFDHTFAHQSAFIKRSLFESIGKYDEQYSIVADWKFFAHAIAKGHSYKTVHEILTTYYLDGVSATGDGKMARRTERTEILKNEFPQFYTDYKERALFKLNRFKILKELEQFPKAHKVVSSTLTALLKIYSTKKVSDL